MQFALAVAYPEIWSWGQGQKMTKCGGHFFKTRFTRATRMGGGGGAAGGSLAPLQIHCWFDQSVQDTNHFHISVQIPPQFQHKNWNFQQCNSNWKISSFCSVPISCPHLYIYEWPLISIVYFWDIRLIYFGNPKPIEKLETFKHKFFQIRFIEWHHDFVLEFLQLKFHKIYLVSNAPCGRLGQFCTLQVANRSYFCANLLGS